MDPMRWLRRDPSLRSPLLELFAESVIVLFLGGGPRRDPGRRTDGPVCDNNKQKNKTSRISCRTSTNDPDHWFVVLKYEFYL